MECIKEFRTKMEEMELTKGTIEGYTRNVKIFLKTTKIKNIDKLSKKILIDYKKELSSGKIRKNSCNVILASLNKLCDTVDKKEAKVSLFKIQQKEYESEEKYFSSVDYKALIKYIDENDRGRIIAETLAYTGLRVSELSNITIESIEKKEVEIYNKGKYRVVRLVNNIVNKLRNYAKSKNITTGKIFVTRTGKAIHRCNIYKILKDLVERANKKLLEKNKKTINEKKIFPHNFRHLFARQFMKINNNIEALRAILGHTSLSTTKIYLRETKNNIANMMIIWI